MHVSRPPYRALIRAEAAFEAVWLLAVPLARLAELASLSFEAK